MQTPTNWLEYWTEAAEIYKELVQISIEAKGATPEQQEQLWHRHEQASARLAALNEIETGKLKW